MNEFYKTRSRKTDSIIIYYRIQLTEKKLTAIHVDDKNPDDFHINVLDIERYSPWLTWVCYKSQVNLQECGTFIPLRGLNRCTPQEFFSHYNF